MESVEDKQVLPAEWLEHLKKAGERGGRANSAKQRQHRRDKALKAMMHKRFPHDPRWFPDNN